MVRLSRNENQTHRLNSRPQMWPSGLALAMNLTLNFQGQIWNLLYISAKKWCDCHETKSKHVDGTQGLKCDHQVWPWPWPWPWIFKVKYVICYISDKNGQIATKRKANISIELQASNVTNGFDLGHNLDIWICKVKCDLNHLVTKARCKDLPDSERGDFRCRLVVDSSSLPGEFFFSTGRYRTHWMGPINSAYKEFFMNEIISLESWWKRMIPERRHDNYITWAFWRSMTRCAAVLKSRLLADDWLTVLNLFKKQPCIFQRFSLRRLCRYLKSVFAKGKDQFILLSEYQLVLMPWRQREPGH